MDDSFMSTSSFDDDDLVLGDDFTIETNVTVEMASVTSIQSSELSYTDDSGFAGSKKKSNILISSYLSAFKSSSQPVAPLVKPTRVLPETPKHASNAGGCHKRKKTARRCLSTDLNKFCDKLDDSFEGFKKPVMLLTPMKSTPILGSIENKFISPPATNHELADIDLTPEFNDLKQKDGNDENSLQYARSKSIRLPLKPSVRMNRGKGTLFKSLSECAHANIKQAVQVSCDDENLIGDCSQHHILPLLDNGKHKDLRSISSHVVADLLNGKYQESVESYVIVDCRYPYEFEGGHIRSAINLYTQESILSEFLKSKTAQTKGKEAAAGPSTPAKRNIVIFHCEFSSERGPNLYRFLRRNDRLNNMNTYPNLHYPEIYLLEGGYKEFYTNYSILCEPQTYLPMHTKEFETELRKFRSIVKTNSYDSKYSVLKRRF